MMTTSLCLEEASG
jgi:hypothetical protein